MKKRQAVFPILMSLIITALLLISTSFAWFSLANTAKISEITCQAESGSTGFMISQDRVNFTRELTFNSDAKSFVLPDRFHQVSTADGINFFRAEIEGKDEYGNANLISTSADYGITSSNSILTGTATYKDSATTTKTVNVAMGSSSVSVTDYYTSSGLVNKTLTSDASYLAFNVYFQVDTAAKIYLNYGTSMRVGTTNAFTTAAVNNAMRVAFLSVDETTGASTLIGIWNPSQTTNDASYYGISSTSGSTTFAPYVSSAYTASVTTKQSSQLFDTTEEFDLNNLPSAGSYLPLAEFTTAGIKCIRVITWLEGNVADCSISVADLWIGLSLAFYSEKINS